MPLPTWYMELVNTGKVIDENVIPTWIPKTSVTYTSGPTIDTNPAVKSETAFTSAEEGLAGVISKGEGTNGNYNAHYGAGSQTKIDFTSMSVNEVRNWQDRFVRSGKPSSAVGKYQIIRSTLDSLIRELKLTGEEKFDGPLQERMFETLLRRRGLDKFRSGTISKEQFAFNLSQEWASLPIPTQDFKDSKGRLGRMGASYYSGDGLNKAHVTPEEVFTSFGSL